MKEDEEFGETYTIRVRYHEGASKLGSDIHGVMCDLAASETVKMRKGEKAGKHVLDCNGNPIYAGSYVHMKYCNKTKRVAQVFAEGEAFELENGTVIGERNSAKSEKILYQDGGWDRATSVYVVNGTMSDALGAISCLERKNKRLKVENEQLKAEIERLKSEAPDDCMRLPLDADGVPIEVGDTIWVVSEDGSSVYDCSVVVVNTDGANGLVRVREKPENGWSAFLFPSKLTHREPDSFEKIAQDALMDEYDYCEEFGLDYGDDSCPAEYAMHSDLVRRMEAVAARG